MCFSFVVLVVVEKYFLDIILLKMIVIGMVMLIEENFIVCFGICMFS